MEEIVVTGRAIEDPWRQASRWESLFRARSIVPIRKPQPGKIAEAIGTAVSAGSMYPAEQEALEKFRAKAKKVATKVKPTVQTIEDLFTPKPKFLPILYEPPKIPEIIVKAKRLPRVVSAIGRASLPLSVAEVGGYLARNVLREAGRQAFEELGRKVTRTIPARPDTPVRTVQQTSTETAIPEVIVTAKRRPRPVALQERSRLQDLFTGSMLNQMQRDMLASTMKTGVYASTAQGTRIKAPTVPKVATSSQVATVTDLLTIPRTTTATRTRTRTMTLPATKTQTRRSTLLGIGTGAATVLATGIATGIATQSKLAQITRVGQATKYCQPCPRRKKKRRTKCYRQLVKQGRYETRDKINKWAQIDCDTGKTIKELI